MTCSFVFAFISRNGRWLLCAVPVCCALLCYTSVCPVHNHPPPPPPQPQPTSQQRSQVLFTVAIVTVGLFVNVVFTLHNWCKKKKYFNLNPTSTHSPTPTHWLTLKHTTHQQTKNSPANPDQHFGDNFGGFPYNSFVDQFVPLKISAVTGLYSSKRKNNKRKREKNKKKTSWMSSRTYFVKNP